MSAFGRVFRPRRPVSVIVEWADGEPVRFRRRASRRAPVYRIVDVRERWVEGSPWSFPSPMPVGGDRVRCWRIRAHRVDEPPAAGTEFVLRMRAGPGVWELVPGSGRPIDEEGER